QSWPVAQRLAEATLARHPEAAHVVLHVTPPGAADSENLVIGSTIGRLGKKADEDDLRIMHEARTETVVAKSGDRFNVSLPLIDHRGGVIGVVAIGFPYKAGDDKALLVADAERIRDELRDGGIDAAKLFAVTP
ncbi:MAG TPA: TonB-dependent siderophore receptor, partial [Burkholderiaceae bacterium]|nr:TonB-dependent siderophore receptor [Burkholderiaceae bacterium]